MIDTSAAMAMLAGEVGGGEVAVRLEGATHRMISAATLVELGIVLGARYGPVGTAILERFLKAAQLDVVGVDREQADLAIDAWHRFGKGRHPAGLNYGDCFSYALGAITGAPIICTGDDFPQTDAAVVRV